jgi:NAD-dependent SIR2 family protein deacetylase
MAHLACRTCGRQIYTVANLEALFAEERRCPGCGQGLQPERRMFDRRQIIRRQYVPDFDPIREERVEDRRKMRRRQTLAAVGTNRIYGWTAR